ncbi:unnamed protein product [Kuraishia capsulata CBS 1993]|uniref:Uncharacterized protein n=1 Tax=Kuraishia capsulata CBS 1993 TaxID=1382522 RepID=W6MKL6_9ASCO|nr:unnamed protein product [Kuraishia capsulata CBS 1993]
MRENRSARIV